MDKESWLLLMNPDERGRGTEIKTMYHNKTREEMVEMMHSLQDLNEHLVLSLVKINPKSTYENIIKDVEDDSEMFFMDSKRNWNRRKTFEDLKDELLEEQVMESLINGDMGVA